MKDINGIPEFVTDFMHNAFKYSDANEDDAVFAVKIFFKTRTFTWLGDGTMINEDGSYTFDKHEEGK